MYAINQCSDPRDFESPRYKAVKVSVLSSKSIFSIDAKAVTNFDSFVPWRHKISWVRALIDRIHRICTPNKIKTELKLIRKFLSWNGFPKRVVNLLIDRFTTDAQKRASDHNANDTSHNNHKLLNKL